MQGTLTFTSGRLYAGQVRKLLERAKFDGYKIEWFEDGALIQRQFTVKGDMNHLKILKNHIDNWGR